MFWDFMNAIKSAIISLGEMLFDIFDKVGATETIIAFSVVCLFVSFVVLGSKGVLSSGYSDMSKRKRSE